MGAFLMIMFVYIILYFVINSKVERRKNQKWLYEEALKQQKELEEQRKKSFPHFCDYTDKGWRDIYRDPPDFYHPYENEIGGDGSEKTKTYNYDKYKDKAINIGVMDAYTTTKEDIELYAKDEDDPYAKDEYDQCDQDDLDERESNESQMSPNNINKLYIRPNDEDVKDIKSIIDEYAESHKNGNIYMELKQYCDDRLSSEGDENK